MKTCPRCSEICSNKSNFCSNCGYAFGEIAREPQEEARTVAPAAPFSEALDLEKGNTASTDAADLDKELEAAPVVTIPELPEEKLEPEIYIELVRIEDDEALIMPSEIYIDNDYAGTLEYNSRKKYPVSYGRHVVVIETGEQRRTRQFDNSRSEPVQVYRYTVRPHNASGKAAPQPKKKHTFAKIFCTLIVLLTACAMLLPKKILDKAIPSGFREQVISWADRTASSAKGDGDGDLTGDAPVESPAPSPADSAVPESTPAAVPSAEQEAMDSPNAEGYNEIYQEYAEKIRAATPGLIQEFSRESESNTGGVTGLVEINNAKVARLAAIYEEGTEKMADYMWIHGSGEYSEYSLWVDKLKAVYDEEAQKITDTYMAASVDSLG